MEDLPKVLRGRPLYFIWILDCSKSMGQDGKIQALNAWIRESIPEIRRYQEHNPHLEILVRAITFSDGARWHISEPTSIMNLEWEDVVAGGA